jgi:leucyl-tRNA synthetase
MEAFRMNTVVSKLMELNNVIEKQKSITKESYKQFVKMLSPVVPFLSSEIWNKLDSKKLLQEDSWPEVDKNYLVAEKIEVVVQVNGKVRDHIEVDAGISDEELKKTALESGKVLEYIKDKEIVKTIVVPKKLVSIVLKNI